jgi:hypothetical protein
MNMHHYCNSENIARNVLIAAFSLICLLRYPPLLSNSADAFEKISLAFTCTNNEKSAVDFDVLNTLTDTSIINIDSEDQNEKEDFNHAIFTEGSNRLFLRKKQAFLIYTIASQMPGHLAPPPKNC